MIDVDPKRIGDQPDPGKLGCDLRGHIAEMPSAVVLEQRAWRD